MIQKLIEDGIFQFLANLAVAAINESLSLAGIVTKRGGIFFLVLAALACVSTTYFLPHIWKPTKRSRAVIIATIIALLLPIGLYENNHVVEVAAPPQVPLFGSDQPCGATFENLHAEAGRDFVNAPAGRSLGNLCIRKGDIKVGRDVFHERDQNEEDALRPGSADSPDRSSAAPQTNGQ